MPNNQYQAQPSGSAMGGPESGGRLADKAEQAAEQLTSSAIQRAEEARERAGEGLEQRRDQVVERIQRLGDAMRRVGDDLRQQDPSIARFVDRAVEGTERAASYVRSATVRGVSDDVERFARGNPAWFFGGAFALGLLAGRFLKSSGAAAAEGGASTGTSSFRGSSFGEPAGEPPSRYGDVGIGPAEPFTPGSGEGTGVP